MLKFEKIETQNCQKFQRFCWEKARPRLAKHSAGRREWPSGPAQARSRCERPRGSALQVESGRSPSSTPLASSPCVSPLSVRHRRPKTKEKGRLQALAASKHSFATKQEHPPAADKHGVSVRCLQKTDKVGRCGNQVAESGYSSGNTRPLFRGKQRSQ